MKPQLTKEQRLAVRKSLRRYIQLARQLSRGQDVTELLKDEFTRNASNYVCMLADHEAEGGSSSPCRVCVFGHSHEGARGCLQEISGINEYEMAAELYLAVGNEQQAREGLLQAAIELISGLATYLHQTDAVS